MERSGGERTGRCVEPAAWPGLTTLAGPMARELWDLADVGCSQLGLEEPDSKRTA